ncbi:MAG: Prophage tail fiber assembly protein TfaE [Candidatus Erwinia impunctatus]|nr:Prophage tail fiber assembly protein TfaE [Culicoides impunctatus]
MNVAILNDEGFASDAGKVTVFNYDSTSREYTGATDEYLAIGVGLPANACIDKPPQDKEGFVLCRTIDNQGWEYQEDHRGEIVYDVVSGQTVTVTQSGPYSENVTIQAPATPYDVWNGSCWITDNEAAHIAIIRQAWEKQQSLIDEALAAINIIQLKLQAGRTLTSVELEKLNKVLDYIDAVTSLTLDVAPDIIWPKKPAL